VLDRPVTTGGACGIAALLLATACGVASIPSATPPEDSLAPRSPAALGGACTPNVELAPEDPAKLPKCECKDGGKARCVSTAKMPAILANQLAKCDGDEGACVPDTIIQNGKPPPTCAAKGKPGRCLSMCVPVVAKYAASYLTRGDGDACPSDERCVPCENPLDGTPTGVCDIGEGKAPSAALCGGDVGNGGGIGIQPGEAITCPFSGTPADVNRFPACGAGGRCMEAGLIADPRVAARLAPCAGGLCVPEVYVREKGQHLPKSCSSFAGIEGRCFSTVFRDVSEQEDFLDRDACNADERCVPCFNPATGAPTGACDTVSCDKAKNPPKPLADCCKVRNVGRGKCVPRTDVPLAFQERLSDRECTGNDLCVPNENLDPNVKPVVCASSNGKGVCVSNCLEFGFLEEIFLDQGSCRSDQTCVPCRDPGTGQPTNAPGCTP
jgi:hypothetical protein